MLSAILTWSFLASILTVFGDFIDRLLTDEDAREFWEDAEEFFQLYRNVSFFVQYRRDMFLTVEELQRLMYALLGGSETIEEFELLEARLKAEIASYYLRDARRLLEEAREV